MRPAQNGDKVVQLSIRGGEILDVGILFNAVAGNDYCNGSIAPTSPSVATACLCDCLHADDVAAMLAEKGLDKRHAGM